ncbi:MAG: hypothetical protein DMG27_13425, partial [Acidobacteria bacterium]
MANTDSGEESVLPSEGEQMETANTLLLATGQGHVEVPKNWRISETKADDPGKCVSPKAEAMSFSTL